MEKKNNISSDPIPIDEWDVSVGMGILPDYVSLTQNIGCGGGKTKIADKIIHLKNSFNTYLNSNPYEKHT
jgi:hypothetical protein